MDGAPRLDKRLELIFAHRNDIADAFYSKLFAALPEVQEYLFRDFGKQKKMFAMMTTILAQHMSRKSDFGTYADQLARVHSQFDITREQFEIGGMLLKASIAEVLGKSLGPRDQIALDWAVDRLIAAMVPRRAA